MTDAPALDTWARLTLALRLLRADPGLGGLVLRGRVGPAQSAALDLCRATLGPLRKVPVTVGPEDLDGGLDVQATLAAGAPVMTRGLLAWGGPLILPMGERAQPFVAKRLAAHLDAGHGPLIACDEGKEDEALPADLTDRCAFHIDLGGLAMADLPTPETPVSETQSDPRVPDDTAPRIVALAEAFGIDGLRAPLLALRALRGLTAVMGHDSPTEDDITTAVQLVLAHRATRLPAPPEDDPTPEPQSDDQYDQPDRGDTEQADALPDDMLIEAIRAALPPDLLARLNAGQTRSGSGSGSGAKRQGNRRGRPLPARGARGGAGARIDLIASLRAAAPWQTLRKRQFPERTGPIILTSDLRHKRYEQTSDRLLIFAVDASGSAAIARLAEAKGAVELLLAEAYARRDHVALIAFRGREADLLLPPTRSLVQTKRRLADLPGGGATPLASGLVEAQAMARAARRKGLTPTLVLLTDGRSNIALDGTANRAQAAEDVTRLTRLLAADRLDAIVIDTGRRPEDSLRQMAQTLGGAYLPLPRADARSLSGAISAAMGD
ncbi:magnesium chelatase subunit D [Jannaschia pohangensis]|uniref:Protoporphyrin IX magnesium-chelatase n=1 Tax=Jannaschia pohangensis TaxID=390807 RepID=A0A1I3UPJ9_9RHOB|nr:magnesium chelatase subunit D [Jannaschia pohangensis]SFJ84629.1 protoporphyrin IX magnesium-chelatase [Jannaschia pohangensis]